jgi:hypothetical protein
MIWHQKTWHFVVVVVVVVVVFVVLLIDVVAALAIFPNGFVQCRIVSCECVFDSD